MTENEGSGMFYIIRVKSPEEQAMFHIVMAVSLTQALAMLGIQHEEYETVNITDFQFNCLLCVDVGAITKQT